MLFFRVMKPISSQSSQHYLLSFVLCIFALCLLIQMIHGVFLGKELLVGFDLWVNQQVTALWSPVLNMIFILITEIGNTDWLIALSLVLSVVLIHKKRLSHAALVLCSMLGTGLVLLMKWILERPRPLEGLIDVSGYSFPSGHAAMSLIFFGLLIYFFKDDIKNLMYRRLFIVGCVILFLAVGFSRLYLNVHWFSDVIAGFALGLFWITALILIFKIAAYLRIEKMNKGSLKKKSLK